MFIEAMDSSSVVNQHLPAMTGSLHRRAARRGDHRPELLITLRSTVSRRDVPLAACVAACRFLTTSARTTMYVEEARR